MWSVQWDDRAVKELRRLDSKAQVTILQYLKTRISTDEDPRRFGKPLVANKSGLWRYRIGDYRLICAIEENILNVLIIAAGHRKEIYK